MFFKRLFSNFKFFYIHPLLSQDTPATSVTPESMKVNKAKQQFKIEEKKIEND